jgi:hypothetical protein
MPTGSSSYPTMLDGLTTIRSDSELIGPDAVNHAAAINTIQGELGTTPSGPYSTVKARLDASDHAAVVATKAELITAQTDLNADGGGKIILQPGNYDFANEDVNFSYSGITYEAAYPRGVTFRCTSSDGTDWSPMIVVAGTEAVVFRGIVFDANGQATTPVLGLRGVRDHLMDDCEFIGGPLHGGIGTCYTTGGDTALFSGAETDGLTFHRCKIGPSGDGGLGFLGGSGGLAEKHYIRNVKMIDCEIEDCDKSGVIVYMYNLRGIEDFEVRSCRFDNNARAETISTNSGHFVDVNRTGIVNCHVHHSKFYNTQGWPGCGGFADHAGHGGTVHHNVFDLGQVRYGQLQWTVAIGEDNDISGTAIPPHQRTWDYEFHHNKYYGCGNWDYDSTRRIYAHHELFYRCLGAPIVAFNHHLDDRWEDCDFIENGQGAGINMVANDAAAGTLWDYQKCGISFGAAGVSFRNLKFRDQQTGRAQLTTNFTGATNNDLTFRAVDDGTDGNSLTVAFVVSGTNMPLSASISGNAVTVTVATNGAGAATSTARQVQVAVNSHASIRPKMYVNLATSNDGTGVVAAQAATALSGGNTTLTQTQTGGIYEHDTGTGASWLPQQNEISSTDCDFGNTPNPLMNRRTGATHPHYIKGNKGEASRDLASAAALVLPAHTDFVNITGTTTITSIEAEKDREITLLFASTAQVTDGSNLVLAGNFTGGANRVLRLVCNGTNWYEMSRSTN